MNDCWLVANTKPNKEKLAYFNLVKQGFKVFLPKIYKITFSFNKENRVLKPLFPGYIFVNIECNKNWSKIDNTFGVKRVF